MNVRRGRRRRPASAARRGPPRPPGRPRGGRAVRGDHADGVTTAHSSRPKTARHVDGRLHYETRVVAPRPGGGAVIAPGQLAGFWSRIAQLDDEIAATHAEGYCVDGLLDDRLDWQRERKDLMDRCTET